VGGFHARTDPEGLIDAATHVMALPLGWWLGARCSGRGQDAPRRLETPEAIRWFERRQSAADRGAGQRNGARGRRLSGPGTAAVSRIVPSSVIHLDDIPSTAVVAVDSRRSDS